MSIYFFPTPDSLDRKLHRRHFRRCRIAALQSYLDQRPDDVDAWLVMAYHLLATTGPADSLMLANADQLARFCPGLSGDAVLHSDDGGTGKSAAAINGVTSAACNEEHSGTNAATRMLTVALAHASNQQCETLWLFLLRLRVAQVPTKETKHLNVAMHAMQHVPMSAAIWQACDALLDAPDINGASPLSLPERLKRMRYALYLLAAPHAVPQPPSSAIAVSVHEQARSLLIVRLVLRWSTVLLEAGHAGHSLAGLMNVVGMSSRLPSPPSRCKGSVDTPALCGRGDNFSGCGGSRNNNNVSIDYNAGSGREINRGRVLPHRLPSPLMLANVLVPLHTALLALSVAHLLATGALPPKLTPAMTAATTTSTSMSRVITDKLRWHHCRPRLPACQQRRAHQTRQAPRRPPRSRVREQ